MTKETKGYFSNVGTVVQWCFQKIPKPSKMGLNAIYLSRLSDLAEKEQSIKVFKTKSVIVDNCITL